MIRQKLTVTAAAAAFALSLTPAWAFQDAKGNAGQAGSRPSGGASSSGSAAPRGGGSSGGGSGGSSSGSSAGPSSSSSSGSSSGSTGSSGSSGATRGARAPERSPERATDRRSGASSDRAVARGTAGRSADAANSSVSGSQDRLPSRDREPVPAYSRPRDGRTPIGNAVERRNPVPGRGDGYYPSIIYDPYYSSYYRNGYGYGYGNRYSYWSPFGYGYGLGYFSYDPYLVGGYGSGYDPYGYGYGYDGYQGHRAAEQYREAGSLRLKVKPTNAQVLIDGYFVGVVDSFDGVFQRLGVDSGPHRVELRAEGYEPVVFEVMIVPGETVTYKGEMKRIR